MGEKRVDVAEEKTLRDYAEMRRGLRPSLVRLCDGAGLPVPARHSDEEVLALRLISPYEAAMTEMADQRKEAGRALVKHQVNIESACAFESLVARGAPRLLEKRLIANPLREGLLREQARHYSAQLVGGVITLALGAVFGTLEALIEALEYSLSRAMWVVAPAMLTVVFSLLVQTMVLKEPLSLGVIGIMIGQALWSAMIVALFAVVACVLHRAYKERV